MAGEPVITIVGNLTGDPELRYVGSGTPVASFTIASTPRVQNRQTQQWEEGETLFIRCSVWREYGENVVESLSKGMRVIATGRLSSRSYEWNGQQRSSLEMQVDEIGPSLRFARVQVNRTQGGSRSAGGNFGSNNYQGDNSGAYSNNAYYNAPQGGSDNDPWGVPGNNAGESTPPF